MGKYCGSIKFIETKETSPGIFEEVSFEKTYYGDILSASKRNENSQEGTNDNISINLRISIIADAYVMKNYSHIKAVSYNGEFWSINSIEFGTPRIILSIGGLYNGN